MKNILFLTAFIFCFCTAWAQVPDSISKRFSMQYPEVKNQTWKTENNRYRVTYRDNMNMEQSVIYDRNGQIYGKRSEVQTQEVPPSVSEYYSKNYPGESKYKVYRETDTIGGNSYYIDRKGERIYFDNQGAYQRKTSTTPTPNRTKP
jgi:hypothetical protein